MNHETDACESMRMPSSVNPRFFHGELDKSIIKQPSFGKKYNYVEASDMLVLLSETYNNRWSFEIIDHWVDDLFGKDMIFNVLGRMTIPGLGMRMNCASVSYVAKCVKKEGRTQLSTVGGLEEVSANNLIFDNHADMWKSAVTDCMKKLASWFRIAEAVYGATPRERLLTNSGPGVLTPDQRSRLTKLCKQFSKKKDEKEAVADGAERLVPYLLQYDAGTGSVRQLHSGNVDSFIAYVLNRVARQQAANAGAVAGGPTRRAFASASAGDETPEISEPTEEDIENMPEPAELEVS